MEVLLSQTQVLMPNSALQNLPFSLISVYYIHFGFILPLWHLVVFIFIISLYLHPLFFFCRSSPFSIPAFLIPCVLGPLHTLSPALFGIDILILCLEQPPRPCWWVFHCHLMDSPAQSVIMTEASIRGATVGRKGGTTLLLTSWCKGWWFFWPVFWRPMVLSTQNTVTVLEWALLLGSLTARESLDLAVTQAKGVEESHSVLGPLGAGQGHLLSSPCPPGCYEDSISLILYILNS